jgi:hypothetical protein
MAKDKNPCINCLVFPLCKSFIKNLDTIYKFRTLKRRCPLLTQYVHLNVSGRITGRVIKERAVEIIKLFNIEKEYKAYLISVEKSKNK